MTATRLGSAATDTGSTDAGSSDAAAVVELRGVPGWSLHLALAVAGLGLVAAAVDPRIWSFEIVAAFALVALVAAAFPWSPVPIALMIATAACQLFTGGVTVDVRLAATAVLLQVVHVLASLTAVVPLWSRLDPRALLPSVRRLLVVVALSVPVFLAARFVGPGLGSGLLFVVTGLALLALVGVALAMGNRPR